MPRANRHFLPGLVWHITHRCHRREFLLKFARDRRNYLQWLYQARKRFGLCILNYIITCNHIHLLILDRGDNNTARSMQLAAGRTAQQYNRRKSRQGAFWEDRYHATAIQNDAHLHRCMTYIDLNMVRARAVSHPQAWAHSGYNEIQNAPSRYRVIDLDALAELCGFSSTQELQRAHRQWVRSALAEDGAVRQAQWSEAIAVGSERFTLGVKARLGISATHREVVRAADSYALREPLVPYAGDFTGEMVPLSSENRPFWNTNVEVSDA
jgi:putative transposase